MQINGIIAEYNPFHNGHQYHIEESLRLTGADYTIVVMSGSFVQRGAPALLDKRLRAEAALHCGADLVLELPVLYAASSAEFFAAGASALLDRLGVVTHLCFGSECGDANALGQIAQILSEEPEEYRAALKAVLKQGASYPKARLQALGALNSLGSSGALQNCPHLPSDCAEILSTPNNILGIEYIRALRKRKSSICPVTLQRRGAGYHDTVFQDDTAAASNGKSGFCSAAAIRQGLCEEKGGTSALANQLWQYMPPEAARLLHASRPLFLNDFSSLLYYRLIMESASGYEKYLDISRGLSDRIRNLLPSFTGFEAFCNALKTKDMTYTRISRCLLHILLGITKDDMELGEALDYTPYARVLGFRRSAVPLLGAIKRHSDIPLVTSVPDARKSLSAEADRLLELDILASRIYRGIALAGTGQAACNEVSAPPVIL